MASVSEEPTELYMTSMQTHTLTLSASDIRGNLDRILEQHLKREVGDKCTRYGYIDRDSVVIVRRSIGSINTVSLNGSLRYDVAYRANVCNPLEGSVIRCKAISINKMGILAEQHPVSVVLARQHSNDEEKFNNVKEGDDILVRIIGKRFELNDEQITAIGQLV